jgi:Xaa-Pro aminopeptidase
MGMRDAQVSRSKVKRQKAKGKAKGKAKEALLLTLLPFALCLLTFGVYAERFGYPPGEFTARRERLVAALRAQGPDRGTVVLFGASTATPGVRFRQDHDFYYLTGSEALNAVLVMDVPSGDAHIFMPKLSATQVQFNGGNWLDEGDAAAKYGFASVQPLPALLEFLMKRRGDAAGGTMWVRLSDRDEIDQSRGEIRTGITRRRANPFAQYPTEDGARAAALRAEFASGDFRDVTPHLDRLRLIKSAREIEILRYNGRISAEAMVRAIRVAAPGRFEYELEAEATGWLIKHGLQAAAYPAIVGSGPMGNQWHYQDNGRQMKAGELIVMDYAGSLDYLTVDITRTWPVSGRFTDQQRRAYDAVLATQKAIIAAIKPGAARIVVRRIAEDTMRKQGFDPRYANSGHYVGLSVHDVGDSNLPFAEGMVLAIEPIIDLPDQQLHVRIEDTVLVTATGAEILSTAVPKEVNELLALMKR